ncbi:MAG: ParB N-terminal domain-containing protein [Desulfobacula sp.]|jgi:ParB/RepB/Spo0J family partition protein|uniref:DNA methyltransferase n=2 Tax=Desulfobacula sp. TaxID=2593537 RepID=UPI001D4D2F56|nr:ParB N-terminal domain-containing protein [Desulfobacula sp.]MBT3805160.1 ParB N-terminal domain-containing protein [Desulfobacula sp.]MBT4025535.1 ParB N-terminal domain-containing protein [Desulfobacula sp.]MBT4198934.1 ParB N-terminal domain-containing protein [Desulfobacula sp.]MBT4506821.1 ParB N-terminal domain-containing protein [Desulfobacula sp.]
MTIRDKLSDKIAIMDVTLDESIYPREKIDHTRVHIFSENLREGFKFDPIEVQIHPDKKGKYRILDGVHRWNAHKEVGLTDISVIIRDLKAIDPLLYAAKMAIGPKQLTEKETRSTARRAFKKNPGLTSSEIGKLIGRSRQTIDNYIADLRAVQQIKLDRKIWLMNRLGIPQDRIARRLGETRDIIRSHLGEMPILAKSPFADLSLGLTIPQVATKHNWSEPMLWSLVLEGQNDQARFKALGWGLRTWDLWNFNECDSRFGDDWPGRIPAQMIGHILFYFSHPRDLIFDPMAGGGVTADTCLALGRKCWSLDMEDRPDSRPEIEPYYWDMGIKSWGNTILGGREKPDLIIFDPPYFQKKAADYGEKSIAQMSRSAYLNFLDNFFRFLKKTTKKTTRLALINSDWRDFQSCPALEEETQNAILLTDYYKILEGAGWELTHIIQAPLSSERFNAISVSAMQKKKILGVTSRYILLLKQKS